MKTQTMKHLLMLVCLCSLIGCSTATKTNSNLLNGTWVPVKQEMGGKEFPSAVFEKQKLVISDSMYTLSAESVDKGALQYANGKMDIYGREGVNAGKHFTAIYTHEADQLTICYNLKGDSYPEAFETTGKPMLFLSVFKHE